MRLNATNHSRCGTLRSPSASHIYLDRGLLFACEQTRARAGGVPVPEVYPDFDIGDPVFDGREQERPDVVFPDGHVVN